MSLFKIPFIALFAVGHHIAWTPPMPPPNKDEQIKAKGWEVLLGKQVRNGMFAAKMVVWLAAICEAIAIICTRNPSYYLSRAVHSKLNFGGSSSDIRITGLFLLGWALVVFGSLIRLICYRTLGHLFTYELTIRDNHMLITDGPYAFVRHPSYTGGLLVTIGTVLCNLSAGSWIIECGVWNTGVGKGVIIAWMLWSFYVAINMLWRLRREDGAMKSEFGQQWVEWEKRVPYRLVPRIF